MWKWLWLGIMCRIWENFEACDRKGLNCLEETIGRRMDMRGTVAARKEVRKRVEEASVILEGMCIIMSIEI